MEIEILSYVTVIFFIAAATLVHIADGKEDGGLIQIMLATVLFAFPMIGWVLWSVWWISIHLL